ncbi:MAG: hypothetical protein Q4A66_01970 [Eubacteriales bacterium]|nr:hypothetical protein [Eubacteriales bacterium]
MMNQNGTTPYTTCQGRDVQYAASRSGNCANACAVAPRIPVCRFNVTLYISIVILAAAVGLIVGLVFTERLTAALPALIVLAVALAVEIAAVLIYNWYRNRS